MNLEDEPEGVEDTDSRDRLNHVIPASAIPPFEDEREAATLQCNTHS